MPAGEAQRASPEDQALVARARMALEEVDDPELPGVSLPALGMVAGVEVRDGTVLVELMPTFVGCPALPLLAGRVQAHLARSLGLDPLRVKVAWTTRVMWTTQRITPQGAQAMRQLGVAPPPSGQDPEMAPSAVPCPYCGSVDTALESRFGSTPCRTLRYCRSCHTPFEAMKCV
jgi:ring-1,2-phenylacetyl-CoA epoxidase subunit PaaD